jgi:hypothetical protein
MSPINFIPTNRLPQNDDENHDLYMEDDILAEMDLELANGFDGLLMENDTESNMVLAPEGMWTVLEQDQDERNMEWLPEQDQDDQNIEWLQEEEDEWVLPDQNPVHFPNGDNHLNLLFEEPISHPA